MTESNRNMEFIKDIVADVKHDYQTRREQRRHFESQWQLNCNFLAGNQYCSVGINGMLSDCGKDYFWQEREVFNHIAFILETRLAKLNKVRPKLGVRPLDNGEEDIRAAQVSGKILDSAYSKLGIESLLMRGTQWSETAGSVFYKVSWDKNSGRKVGRLSDMPVFEGDVKIDICPPFEIFPDSITRQDVEDCASIIHARAVHVDDIMRIWGQAVSPEAVDTLGQSGAGILGGLGLSSAVPAVGRMRSSDYAMVVERYTAPTEDKPEGELAIVAGDKLLHYGTLPFCCGANGGFALPFVKQDSLTRAGCFFGTSVIERAIPIQRAYNAVKNRKHEFLNRLSMGVLAVEDGSVDTENLETEGLSPGKILVYRQGSTPPALLDPGKIPADFAHEEERLLSEFIMISGVSDVMRSSSVPGAVASGTALKMLMEQDDARLSTTAERIRTAAKTLAQFVLRLYKQFACQPRLSRCTGCGGQVELLHWQSESIAGDDVVLTSENELEGTATQRRAIVLELLGTGLLQDESGRIPADLRHKVLDALGYGSWEQAGDIRRLHALRAQRENGGLAHIVPTVKDIDDHRLHIAEHTKFMLGGEYEAQVRANPALEGVLLGHIEAHKIRERAEKAAEKVLPTQVENAEAAENLENALAVNSANALAANAEQGTGSPAHACGQSKPDGIGVVAGFVKSNVESVGSKARHTCTATSAEKHKKTGKAEKAGSADNTAQKAMGAHNNGGKN